MHTSRLGGVSDREDTAVAVIPLGAPSRIRVTIWIVEATPRMARRKSSDNPAAGAGEAVLDGSVTAAERIWAFPSHPS